MKIKKILYIFLWILVLAGIGFLLSLCYKAQKHLRCKGYSIEIEIAGKDTLLYQSDIQKIIVSTHDSIIGKRFTSINLTRLERELQKNIYINEAEVFSNLSGYITIRVKQFNPIVRLITTDQQSFYLDEQGNKIPAYRPAYVVVANGNFQVNHEGTDQSFKDVIHCVTIIRKDPFLNAQIGQIYLDNRGLYRLIPVVGDHEIILGDSENFEDGLDKLQLFYKKGIDGQCWKDVKQIDLRFLNQIVCSKNNIAK